MQYGDEDGRSSDGKYLYVAIFNITGKSMILADPYISKMVIIIYEDKKSFWIEFFGSLIIIDFI